MRFVLIVLAVAFAVLWVIQVKQQASEGEIRLWNAFLGATGKALVVIGLLAIAGPGLSTVGGLNGLPSSFEWPVSGTHSALKLPSGIHAVPQKAVGRIQLYDENLQFLLGWQVDGYTRDFYLLPSKQDTFYALAVRDNIVYEYDFQGELVSTSAYERPVSSGSSQPAEVTFKLNPLLWPFSSLGAGLTILLAGALFVWLSKER